MSRNQYQPSSTVFTHVLGTHLKYSVMATGPATSGNPQSVELERLQGRTREIVSPIGLSTYRAIQPSDSGSYGWLRDTVREASNQVKQYIYTTKNVALVWRNWQLERSARNRRVPNSIPTRCAFAKGT